jgi:hypothetical protein
MIEGQSGAAAESGSASIPLMTLRRGLVRMELHDRVRLPGHASASNGFRGVRDAASYLSVWRREPGAMGGLRAALARCERGAPLAALSDDQVIDALAKHLTNGTLAVVEEPISLTPPAAAVAAAAQAAAAAAAIAALDAPTLPPVAAPKPPEVPILAALENVQIEGAEVLPEVNQSLDQIDLTIASVASATTSLEPAPSGVPAISSAVDDASTSVTGTLDDL